jgi:hypothetical protein
LEALDFCANPAEAKASAIATSGGTTAKRYDFALVLKVVLNNGLAAAAMPGRANPFQHANLDAVTPPRARYIQGTKKKARKPVKSARVFRCAQRQWRDLEPDESVKVMFRIGI